MTVDALAVFWDDSWYRDVTEFAAHTPGWLRGGIATGTDVVLLVPAFLSVLTWWKSRRGTSRGVVLALLVPVATLVALLLSEIVKSLVRQERPCRAVADVVTLVPCPASGDWSFPSNHATVAAAATVGLVLAWRMLALLVVPVGLALAFSRVYVGVHYPHDVLAGVALGAGVSLLLVWVLVRPLTRAVDRLRTIPVVGVLVASATGPTVGGVDGVGDVDGAGDVGGVDGVGTDGQAVSKPRWPA